MKEKFIIAQIVVRKLMIIVNKFTNYFSNLK